MDPSESYRSGAAARLTLEHGRAPLLDKAGVGRPALVAQDERLDVSDQFLLDSHRRDPSLEHHTDLLPGA